MRRLRGMDLFVALLCAALFVPGAVLLIASGFESETGWMFLCLLFVVDLLDRFVRRPRTEG